MMVVETNLPRGTALQGKKERKETEEKTLPNPGGGGRHKSGTLHILFTSLSI